MDTNQLPVLSGKTKRKRYSQIAMFFITRIRSYGNCSVCGSSDHLQFHHIHPGAKKYTISSMAGRSKSLRAIFNEVKKCTLLCDRCHKKIHKTKGCELSKEFTSIQFKEEYIVGIARINSENKIERL